MAFVADCRAVPLDAAGPLIETDPAFPERTNVEFATIVDSGRMDLRVWADDQQVDGHFLLAVATNIRRYVGGLAVLSPDAYLDDGQMDLWLISGRTLADALRAFFEVLAGSHVTSEQARRLPFRSAQVESDTPFSIQMDGDPMLGSKQVEVRVQKQALKVLMPPQGAKLLRETARA